MLSELLAKILGGGDPWEGDDKRRGLRAECDFEVEIRGPKFAYLGRAHNMGPQGLGIRIRGAWNASHVKRGQLLQVKHVNPVADAESNTVQAILQWAKKETSDAFSVGLAFDNDMEMLRRSWVRPKLVEVLKKRVAQQQRKQVRAKSRFATEFKVYGKSYQGDVRDLSTGGALLEALSGFSPGTILSLHLAPDKKGSPLTVEGQVRRYALVMGTHQMGIAFQIRDKIQKRDLAKLVKTLVDRQNKKGR